MRKRDKTATALRKNKSTAEWAAYFSLACGIAGQIFLFYFKNLPAGLALFAIAAAAFILNDRANRIPGAGEEPVLPSIISISKPLEIIIFFTILALAVFMRLYEINSVPAGCFYDEAVGALTAQGILSGKLPPVFDLSSGVTSASATLYILAAFFKFFGIGVVQIRLVSAVAGILTVPALYFFIRYISGPLPAIIGGLLFAAMRWNVVFSRIGFNAIFAVLMVILILYFAIRAFYGEKIFDFILLGFSLAFSLYTYQSARLAPFVIIVFAVFVFIRDGKFFGRNLKKIIVSASVALVISLPMAVSAAENLNSFMLRQNQVSIFNSTVQWSEKNREWFTDTRPKIVVFADNVARTLLMFNFRGDTNNRHNLSGFPELDFYSGIFAFIGFVYLLSRLASPPYFLMLSGFLIFMTAGFLTIEAPQSLRTLSAAPFVIFFMTVFAARFLSFFRKGLPLLMASLVIGAMILLSCVENYNTYFEKQAHDWRCWQDFSTLEYEAGKMAETAATAGWEVTVPFNFYYYPSFRFADSDADKCKIFSLADFLPGKGGGSKKYLYILPSEYMLLGDYIKELCPDAATAPVLNPYSGDTLYYYYEITPNDLKNIRGRHTDNGANVAYYSGRNFTGDRMEQRVPMIMVTPFDNPGFNIASAEWSAILNVPQAGDYEMNMRSLGRACLFIDNKAVECSGDEDTRKTTQTSAGCFMTEGRHYVVVKYNPCESNTARDNVGLWLVWKKPGDSDVSIISGNLLSPGKL
jgi:4-amino-4-deoxy-L-arabinose transferase-like glycosyltransferase